MTADDFRRIALGMKDASEGSHMGHPDFRVNGRIFATLTEDGKRGMVGLTPELQRDFMEANPGMFAPASGAWGRQGSTMVELRAADEAVVGEAMTLAWQDTARRAVKKKAVARKSVSAASARLPHRSKRPAK